MSRLNEILITSDGTSQMWSVAGWDPQTGTQLTCYRNGASVGFNTVNIVGESYLLAADATKPRLYFWPLNKQTPVENMRFVAPGNVTAMSCSPDGLYIVAAIGEKLCIWQTSSGSLLAVVSRHYQTITCVKFTSDGSTFVSGGEDGLAFVWSLSSIVDQSVHDTDSQRFEALHSFSDHSLAIKDLHIGKFGIQSRVITASLDCTAKIYELDSGTLLLTLVFSSPLTCVCTDVRETDLFVGCTNGNIFRVDLQSPPRGTEHHVPAGAENQIYDSHAKAITCLSVSNDCNSFVSGSADGVVNIWHISSRQVVRTIPHKGPITAAFFTSAVNNFFTNSFKPKLLLHSLQNVARDEDSEAVIYTASSYGKDELLNIDNFLENNVSMAQGDSYAELQKARDEIKALKQTNSALYKLGVQYLLKQNVES